MTDDPDHVGLRSTVPREGLVLELLLDGTADDTVGGRHHGVVHGATPTADRFGTPNGAYLFDGIDDHIVIAPPPRLSGSGLSVSVWARFDTAPIDGWSDCIICQDDGNDEDQSKRVFQLSAFSGRIVCHRMQRVEDPTARQVVPAGTWCHVAAVVDRDVHGLYLNGELQDSAKDPLRKSDDEPIYVGRKGTPERLFFFRGAIDDVRVYNRALAADDVRRLFEERGYRGDGRPVASDAISGSWEAGGGGVRLELRLDEHRVSGVVTSGGPRNFVPIQTGSFDARTRRLKLEGNAPRPDNGVLAPYVIEGRLERRNRLTVAYRFADHSGTVTFSRWTRWRALRKRLRASVQETVHRLEPVLAPIVRRLRALRRPSAAANARRLRDRGETLASLVFRDATPNDIPALAALHVKTWNATYPGVRRPPTYAIREWQWKEAFAKADGTWFCIVIENAERQLVGFAKGVQHDNGVGDLNKIYLLTEYQRLGLGRRLVGHVTRRFLAAGLTSMTLSADAANPSCWFYLALGAENPRDSDGRVHRGAFVWRDLRRLAEICPEE